MQLYECYKTFFTIKNLAEKDSLEYGKWFEEYQQLFNKQFKPELTKLNPKVNIVIDDNLIFQDIDTNQDLSIFSFLGMLTPQQSEAISESLFGRTTTERYTSLKRIVRHVQETSFQAALKYKQNIYFDETGDEPTKIMDKVLALNTNGYFNIIILIHPTSIAYNYIQNAGRMVLGSDGGRDSSSAISESYGKIEKFKRIYTSLEAVDSNHILKIEEVDSLNEQPLIINKINELTKKTTNKDIGLLILVEPNNIPKTLERTQKKIAEIGTTPDESEKLIKLFYAILKLHLSNPNKTSTTMLNNLDAEIKKVLSILSTSEAFKIILAAYFDPKKIGVQIDTLKEAIHIWNINIAEYGLELKEERIIKKP